MTLHSMVFKFASVLQRSETYFACLCCCRL